MSQIIVPYTELSPEALRGIIEYFVLKEGTDYGTIEYSLEEKVTNVQRQLERGQAKIVYDQEEGLCEIVIDEFAIKDGKTDEAPRS